MDLLGYNAGVCVLEVWLYFVHVVSFGNLILSSAAFILSVSVGVQCIENLHNFNTKLVSAVTDKPNVNAAYKKCEF